MDGALRAILRTDPSIMLCQVEDSPVIQGIIWRSIQNGNGWDREAALVSADASVDQSACREEGS